MSIELPSEHFRNLLVIDYLLDCCSLETIIKYFKLAKADVIELVQCNTRFCKLLATYLRSMEQRKNVRFSLSNTKQMEKSENVRIAEQILRSSQQMDCDEPFKLEEYVYSIEDSFEMYATMQMLNVKQSIYATSFDTLLHISIPCSAKNVDIGKQTFSFQPESTFLIESIDIEMTIEKTARNNLRFTIHQKPSICWSKYAWQKTHKEELQTTITNPTQGLHATNASRRKPIHHNQHQFPLKIHCKEWEGNYLIAVLLHCHREFTKENV